MSRFQREALAAARLIHPNIVQVFDSGLDERRDQHYIVMEYIDGQSCAEILRERGWLPVEEALPIILGACAGLDYAHRKGVVHRDVKPGNLLLGTDHVVKLADFGIAKATEQSSITQIGSVLGTAAYLAPEQGRGEEAGPAADIYALGVVAYQLISGRLPFEGASLTELAIKQQREPPPALDTLVAAVTPELARAVDIALRIDPRNRYPTAIEMAHAIDEGARGIAPGSGSAVVPPLATAATVARGRGADPRRGRRPHARRLRHPAPAASGPAPPRAPRAAAAPGAQAAHGPHRRGARGRRGDRDRRRRGRALDPERRPGAAPERALGEDLRRLLQPADAADQRELLLRCRLGACTQPGVGACTDPNMMRLSVLPAARPRPRRGGRRRSPCAGASSATP